MLNRAPIFINGFAHGGTNILQNLIASHPDISLLRAETHELFLGRATARRYKKWLHRFLYLPVLLGTRQQVFKSSNYEERASLSRALHLYIDRLFFCNKIMARSNRLRPVGGPRSFREIARGRLLCKNVNGMVLAAPLFAEIYPDASFVAIVRNGLALCEGYIRRGGDAAGFGEIYRCLCQAMLRDAERLPNYYIVRFEDLVTAPIPTMQQIYQHLGLDFERVTHVKLQARAVMGSDGVRRYLFGKEDREISWFALEELNGYLRKDVNENQIARLNEQEREAFLRVAAPSLVELGYLPTPSPAESRTEAPVTLNLQDSDLPVS